MDKRNFAFDSNNFKLLALSVLIVIVGFILMSGPGSTEEAYNPDIFSVRRIKVAPVVCLVGFVMMIYAVIRKPKDIKDINGDIIEGKPEEKIVSEKQHIGTL